MTFPSIKSEEDFGDAVEALETLLVLCSRSTRMTTRPSASARCGQAMCTRSYPLFDSPASAAMTMG
jgi:hypothetical protein